VIIFQKAHNICKRGVRSTKCYPLVESTYEQGYTRQLTINLNKLVHMLVIMFPVEMFLKKKTEIVTVIAIVMCSREKT